MNIIVILANLDQLILESINANSYIYEWSMPELPKIPKNADEMNAMIDTARDAANEIKTQVETQATNITDTANSTMNTMIDAANQVGSFIEKYNNIITATPDKYKLHLADFFRQYGSNPVVDAVFKISQDSPYVFVGIFAAIPIIALGIITTGGYAITKLLKTKVSPQSITDLNNKMNTTTNPVEKEKLKKELVKVSAVALITNKK